MSSSLYGVYYYFQNQTTHSEYRLSHALSYHTMCLPTDTHTAPPPLVCIVQAPAPRAQQGSILGLDKLAAQKSAEKQAALEAAGLGGGSGRGSARGGGGVLSFADLDAASGEDRSVAVGVGSEAGAADDDDDDDDGGTSRGGAGQKGSR